jgi:GNAT superfamily N-acetyltransferase
MTVITDLRVRTFQGTDDDVDAIVHVLNAHAAADAIDEVWTADGLRAWFGHPSEQFDAARDVLLAELDGRVVATGRTEWVDTRDGRYREYRLHGTVDPALRGRGIGTVLLAELERRQRAWAAEHVQPRETVFMTFAAVGRADEALLRANGYEPARWFIDMVRPTLDDVAMPPLPDGLELRGA